MTEKNIVEGPPVEYTLGDTTLGQLALAILKSQDNKVAQVDALTGEELKTNLILNRAISLARWFDSVGVQTGDAVSVSSENCLEFITVPIAAFFNGITFAPVNPEYTARELNHCLNLSKPKVIFCSSATLKGILQFAANHQYVKHIILFDKQRANQRNVINFADIVKGANDGDVDESFSCKEVDAKETLATILCSSGTTGMPKGVMCTHFNMLSWIICSQETKIIGHLENKVALGIIPFFHSMGFMTMFLFLLGGTKFVVLKKFNPIVFLKSIAKYKVTNLSVPPPVIMFLNKNPIVKKYDLSSLEFIISGAAPLSMSVEKQTTKKYKLTHFGQGYGLTETTLAVLINPPGQVKIGSVGSVFPGMKAKVVDEEGNALGPNQPGELCFKGPLIMKGYVGDPKSTHTMIDKDGWLHTGDIGYYDEDKYFYIIDRVKELIKYKGFQVAPAELEALLITHPAIVDAAVIGLEDEDAGELPLAFVVKKRDSKVTAKEIQEFIAEKVINYKRLRGGVRFIDQIPRNPSGKILRRILKQEANKFKSKL